MTIFAIDLGNKQTKMTDGQHTYIYPSSLLQARKVDSGFSLDDKMDNMEKFKSSAQNGAFYWGKGILKYGKNDLSESLSFDRRYENRIFVQLCEFSLAKLAQNYDEARDGVLTVDYVMAGLPSADADNDDNVKQIKDIFKGQHLVEIDGTPITVKVKQVFVFPQSTGTLYSIMYRGYNFEKPKESKVTAQEVELVNFMNEGVVGIVDIGGGTVLLDILRNSVFSRNDRDQLNLGANTLYENIAGRVSRQFNINADIHKIEVLIRNGIKDGSFVYTRSAINKYDVTDIVKEEIEQWTYEIIDNINSTFKSLSDIDILIVTGGGSEIIDKDIFVDAFPQIKVKFVDDAEVANAKGFYYKGKALELKSK